VAASLLVIKILNSKKRENIGYSHWKVKKLSQKFPDRKSQSMQVLLCLNLFKIYIRIKIKQKQLPIIT